MPKRNAADPRPGVRDPRSTPGDRPLLVVPRRWLATLTVSMVLPWLIAAVFYSRGPSGAATPETNRGAAPGDPAFSASGDPRPWGQLIVTPIVISPPLEYVPSNWGPVEPPRWAELQEPSAARRVPAFRIIRRGVAGTSSDLPPYATARRAVDLQRGRLRVLCRHRLGSARHHRSIGAATPRKTALKGRHDARQVAA